MREVNKNVKSKKKEDSQISKTEKEKGKKNYPGARDAYIMQPPWWLGRTYI